MNRHSRRTLLTSLLLLLVLFSPLRCSAQDDEYTVKAVFLERFTRFIEWPEESAMEDTSKPFVIAVLGEHPFGDMLQEIYSSQKIKDRNVQISFINRPTDIPGCHLLYIAESERDVIPSILAITRDKPILTVADSNGFGTLGVMINLYLDQQIVRFEINEDQIRNSALKFSYLLLQSARLIRLKQDTP